MSQDIIFQRSIVESPHDVALRQVYADWLQEIGDLRGEYVYLEETLRTIPVYSDKYWKLKPRRNELSKLVDPNWRELMEYGTDYEPMFQVIPNDWPSRWRLIREFVERWFQKPMLDIGSNMEAVCQTERRLKRTLPPSLREFVAFAHELGPAVPVEQHSLENPLFGPEATYKYPSVISIETVTGLEFDVEDWRELRLITFASFAGRYFAVNYDHLHLDDPPVCRMFREQNTLSANQFHFSEPIITFSHLTDFIFYMASTHGHGVGGNFVTTGEGITMSPTLRKQLMSVFSVSSNIGSISTFEMKNIVALLRNDVNLFPEIGSTWSLHVNAWKRMPKSSVPPLLLEMAKKDRLSTQVFAIEP